MENILEVKGVGKNFGGFTALSGVNLSIRKGERLGLIGPNGSGKTTLISCISGALQNDLGDIVFNGKAIQTACLPMRVHVWALRVVFRSHVHFTA